MNIGYEKENNSKSLYLWRSRSVSDIFLTSLSVLTHLLLTTILGGRYYSYPHLQMKKMRHRKAKKLIQDHTGSN